jgi:uncharacterized membrane protein YfcA
MGSFKLDQAGLKGKEKSIVVRSIAIGIIASCAGVFMTTYHRGNASSDTMYVVVPLILICIGAVLWIGIRKQRKLWATYELVINEDTIIRKQNNIPTITISKNEIQYIVESNNGIIAIKPMNTNQMIIVPAGITNREELIETLAGFGEIQHP